MTESRPVRISNPGELVEAAPYLLGFSPVNSLVIVGLTGSRVDEPGSLTVTTRVDYPGLVEPGDLTPIADVLHRAGSARAMAILYIEDLSEDPRRDLMLSMAASGIVEDLTALGLEVRDVLAASPGRWWSMLCEQHTCCPPEGTPRSPAAVPAGFEQLAKPADSRAAMFDVLEPATAEPGLEEEIVLALGLIGRPDAGTEQERSGAAYTALCHYARGLAEGRPERRLSRGGLVHCAAVLSNLAVRDLAWMAIDTGEVDHEKLAPLALQVATRAPGAWAAPGYFLWAWGQWRAGNGTLAREAAERAIAAAGGYSAAELLVTAIKAGLSPRSIPALASAD